MCMMTNWMARSLDWLPMFKNVLVFCRGILVMLTLLTQWDTWPYCCEAWEQAGRRARCGTWLPVSHTNKRSTSMASRGAHHPPQSCSTVGTAELSHPDTSFWRSWLANSYLFCTKDTKSCCSTNSSPCLVSLPVSFSCLSFVLLNDAQLVLCPLGDIQRQHKSSFLWCCSNKAYLLIEDVMNYHN